MNNNEEEEMRQHDRPVNLKEIRSSSNIENINKKNNSLSRSRRTNAEVYKKEMEEQKKLDSEGENQQSFYNQRRKMFYLMTISLVIISGIYFGLHFLEPDKTIPTQ